MSKVQMLRAFVNQRLAAAAEEIFELFETTIAEYEEKLEFSSKENHRQRKLLDAVYNPVRLHRAEVQQLLVIKEEVHPEQQEWRSSLDQEDPEPPHIKEEQEELWSSQEGEQLQGLEEADIKFTFTPVPVKSEEHDENGQSPQLHSAGGPESARNSAPDSPLQPTTDDKTSHSEPETDDSRDWEETQEPQTGLNPLQNSEVPLSEKTPISSSECAGRFDHKGHLQKHTGIQTGEKPFSCSICGKRFSQKRSWKTHIRLHSEGKRYSCSVCKVKFNFRSNLVKHMRSHTGEKPFSCSFCSKRFAVSDHLRQHFNIHTGEKPFSCQFCNVRFAAQGNLRRHMTVHTGEKPFSCIVCGKRFAHKGDMKRHLLVHTGEKPFSCSICGKGFTQTGDLRRHLTVHTGEKPFSCSICGKSFTQKGTLKQHLTGHTGEKQFSCNVCNKSFSRLYNVKKHKCVGESSSNK
ncbi:gastrula zinc finger protein XlCGF57.1-like [Epinephelus fuscoguttatus]|uniref:gastrula zinc finger protein XlCGF57.1-like n=1 Tax=Epinephelus fuscoguttatus TaxID=293821 RepID=UPI0020D0BF3C|nr:gastrula zinc finger protein XlCGF57.1-like [Epinephelus fuscoguttatus]